MRRRGGWWSAVILSATLIGGLGWCGWRWWDVRRYREAMAGIDNAMRTGRYGTAIRDLSALRGRGSGSERAAYLLGVCEKALGRNREADAAWAEIPPYSPFGGRAVAARFDLLIEQGRLADAERLVQRATDDLGTHGSAIRMLLIPIFVQEGRAEEAERLIESRWRSLDAGDEGASEQAINLARLHMELRWNVPPADAVRAYLDEMGRLAPDDDRIWLGRANLALRVGSLDEAGRLIDDCLRKRPDDTSVWRARLGWAMRTNRLAEARAALEHLPAGLLTPAEVHRASAWVASTCGDVERERRALAALVAETPEDLAALGRLETLGAGGAKADVDDLRRRRSEIERDQRRYQELYRRNQPARDAEEMAHLAERLGHRFEALLFFSVASAEEPDRVDLREAIGRLGEGRREPIDARRGVFDAARTDRGDDGGSAAGKPRDSPAA